MFSEQEIQCGMCGRVYVTTAGTARWKDGTCSVRCHHEKEWRYTLSLMGKTYYPDPREYNEFGHPNDPPK